MINEKSGNDETDEENLKLSVKSEKISKPKSINMRPKLAPISRKRFKMRASKEF